MVLQPAQLETIARQIRKFRCVPFLGAAVNFRCDKPANYEGLLLGNEVAKELASKIKEKIADVENLPRVSLIYERMVERRALIEKLKDILPDQNREPSRVLQILAALPFDLYITTNYDRLLEAALEPRKPIVVVQTPQELEGRKLVEEWSAMPEDDRPPLVYKIHGTFRELTPAADPDLDPIETSPLIITEDDYIDFLTLLGSKENGVPAQITKKLKLSTLLFLGYSLEDWDFRALYKVIMKSFDEQRFPPPRFSVQKDPRQYWRDFWLGQKINILDVDIYEFADELAKTYKGLFP
jgi:SIR2-like domain